MTNSSRFADTTWRKSSRSASSGECVEVATVPGWIGIRDSKNPDGPVLELSAAAVAAFIKATKKGQTLGA